MLVSGTSVTKPASSNSSPERRSAPRHPASGNAKLIAAREAAIDALASATTSKVSIEARHLQFLIAATEYLNLGDTDPGAEPFSNAR